MAESTGAFDAARAAAWITASARLIGGAADRLTELDTAIGDGDHGRNLTRGFAAAAEKINGADTPRGVLTGAGSALVSSTGGASGPLFGTFLRRTAKALPGAPVVGPDDLADALAAGVAAVRELGGAAGGDKTMVDALDPAVAALRGALADGVSLPAAVERAAEAARAGAEATIPLVARKGRASYLGERSAGHEDPGAASTALLWSALAEATGADHG
jgi:dihydroxyacetone kinase-like protein